MAGKQLLIKLITNQRIEADGDIDTEERHSDGGADADVPSGGQDDDDLVEDPFAEQLTIREFGCVS